MPKKPVTETLHAKGIDISIYTLDFENEFLSLTDIAKYKSDDANATICNWMRNRETIEFLGIWESLHNPDFKPLEFEGFRHQAGLNAFTMSPTKWINGVQAIGIVTKAGRYGGTYAHSDIALEFASWISAEFKLYIMKDYQRIKRDENSRLSLSWNLNREITKLNYRIHTDAVKAHLIPPDLTPEQISYTYASEADLICGESPSDSAGLNAGTDFLHLCQRSRSDQRGAVWPNCQAMAGREPQRERKYAGSGFLESIAGIGEHGKL